MPTGIDPKEILRLYGALKERVLAKDSEGTIQIYEELLRLGQSLSEIMAQAARVLNDPPVRAPDHAGEAGVRGADATVLDGPAPDSARPEPAPEPFLEPSPGSVAVDVAKLPDGVFAHDAPGEASTIAGDTGNPLPLPGPVTAQPEASTAAVARLSQIGRIGLAAGAIAVLAGIGLLLMHPAAEKVASGGLASEAPVSVRSESSSTTKAAPSSTEPEPVPAAQPVPEAPARDVVAAVEAPSPPAAPVEPVTASLPSRAAPTPAEPVPAALPPPAAPTPAAPPAVGAPAAPDRPRLADAEIAVLRARGDSFLGVGDIVSARLFYERASNAGDGRAALRLGATYDPGFLDQLHLPHLQGDVVQALSWYRRARDLGESEAERWIQALDGKSGR